MSRSIQPAGTRSCPFCSGVATLVREKREVPAGRRNRRVGIEDEFYRCETCREEFYAPGMMDESMRSAAASVREADGLLSPDRVLAIRTRLGLTQPEFERLLGVGKNTVVRWERGTVPQGSAADSLLRLIEHYPENARFLAELHGISLSSHEEAVRH